MTKWERVMQLQAHEKEVGTPRRSFDPVVGEVRPRPGKGREYRKNSLLRADSRFWRLKEERAGELTDMLKAALFQRRSSKWGELKSCSLDEQIANDHEEGGTAETDLLHTGCSLKTASGNR